MGRQLFWQPRSADSLISSTFDLQLLIIISNQIFFNWRSNWYRVSFLLTVGHWQVWLDSDSTMTRSSQRAESQVISHDGRVLSRVRKRGSSRNLSESHVTRQQPCWAGTLHMEIGLSFVQIYCFEYEHCLLALCYSWYVDVYIVFLLAILNSWAGLLPRAFCHEMIYSYRNWTLTNKLQVVLWSILFPSDALLIT